LRNSRARAVFGEGRQANRPVVTNKDVNAETTLRFAADLVRVAVLGGAIYLIATGASGDAFRFGVVVLVLLMPRLLMLPPPLDVALCITLPVATLATAAGWYRTVPWLDWVIHCLNTATVSALVFLLLVRARLLPQPGRAELRAGSTVLLGGLLGAAVGVLWEFYEWAGQVVLHIPMEVGYRDTVADLAMDILGGLLAGLGTLALARPRQRDRRPQRPNQSA
jgi:hypothetical protein